MMKQWQRENNVSLKSFQLERLSVEFLSNWESNQRDHFWYDWMVRDFLGYLIGRANTFGCTHTGGDLHATRRQFSRRYRAIRLDETIKDYELLAGEFTNLRDRFRQAKLIGSQRPAAEFEAEVKALIPRLEKARSRVLAPPERYFRKAQKNRYRRLRTRSGSQSALEL
ncbi:hypothetical protein [Bradyrhizobium valentinum]|uniref:Uncharacterized protein n=1 Tax=Bradyrhizobium valentinum TaxID=1518501 RepID=A0A0R3LWP4_9BRAD|nr:hypothetical protein [Bradyrhizobium valentinum]KRR12394.1 hypothetical protein CP49_08165 [Bradyrhizobium valentinum]